MPRADLRIRFAIIFRPLPAANMFVGDTRDLRVGFTRQDDYDLDEMIGTDTDFYDQLPVADLKEYGQNDLLEMRRRSHAHHLKTAFTGIVRGSIRANELRFDGPWVRIRELLTVFNQHTKSRWGVHEVLALIWHTLLNGTGIWVSCEV